MLFYMRGKRRLPSIAEDRSAFPPVPQESPMSDILMEPAALHSGGAMSSLEQQIAEAEAEVKRQREAIAHLAAQGREAAAARQQLIAMCENLAFMKKLCWA